MSPPSDCARSDYAPWARHGGSEALTALPTCRWHATAPRARADRRRRRAPSRRQQGHARARARTCGATRRRDAQASGLIAHARQRRSDTHKEARVGECASRPPTALLTLSQLPAQSHARPCPRLARRGSFRPSPLQAPAHAPAQTKPHILAYTLDGPARSNVHAVRCAYTHS